MRAKQERAIYRAVAITWEEFGVCSEFVMQLLGDADKLDRDALDKVVELFKARVIRGPAEAGRCWEVLLVNADDALPERVGELLERGERRHGRR
jgi:hypothetical protein